jgi:hypothetical protein
MTTQELYDLMSKGFDDLKSTLISIDGRLRNVETDVAELRGRKIGFSVLKDWIVAICAATALIVSIIALVKN